VFSLLFLKSSDVLERDTNTSNPRRGKGEFVSQYPEIQWISSLLSTFSENDPIYADMAKEVQKRIQLLRDIEKDDIHLDAYLINKLLSPGSTLAILAIRNGNFNTARQILETSFLEDSKFGTEWKQILLSEIANAEKIAQCGTSPTGIITPDSMQHSASSLHFNLDVFLLLLLSSPSSIQKSPAKEWTAQLVNNINRATTTLRDSERLTNFISSWASRIKEVESFRNVCLVSSVLNPKKAQSVPVVSYPFETLNEIRTIFQKGTIKGKQDLCGHSYSQINQIIQSFKIFLKS
jgi:hypothetical protein